MCAYAAELSLSRERRNLGRFLLDPLSLREILISYCCCSFLSFPLFLRSIICCQKKGGERGAAQYIAAFGIIINYTYTGWKKGKAEGEGPIYTHNQPISLIPRKWKNYQRIIQMKPGTCAREGGGGRMCIHTTRVYCAVR